MPHLRSHARTTGASPPASSASPRTPPVAIAGGGPSATPGPSPSSSFHLGLGRAAGADDTKSPAVGPPRRSLRLAGASPCTPTAGSSSPSDVASACPGSGGRGRGRPRVSSPDSASRKVVSLGVGGGGSGREQPAVLTGVESEVSTEKLISGELEDGLDGGVEGNMQLARGRNLCVAGARPTTPMVGSSSSDAASTCSGSDESGRGRGRGRGRPRVSDLAAASWKVGGLGDGGVSAEVGVSAGGSSGVSGCEGVFMNMQSEAQNANHMLGMMRVGLVGVVEGKMQPSGAEDEVHDEMLHRSADRPSKRRKSELIGGIERECVMDLESDEDGKLLGEETTKMFKSLSTAPDASEVDVERRGDCTERGKGKPEEDSTHESRKNDKGKGKLLWEDKDAGDNTNVGAGVDTRRRKFSLDGKEMGKMVAEGSVSLDASGNAVGLEPVVAEVIQGISRAFGASVEQSLPDIANPKQEKRREAERKRAIALAPKFAFFKAEEDEHSDENDAEELEPVAHPEDWPGPYSTAMKILDDTDAKLRDRELNSSKLDKSVDKVILWMPSKERKAPLLPVPSLKSLCLQVLSDCAEGIESLEGVPDELKHELVTLLCHSRKMNIHLLSDLLRNKPTMMQLSDCSWLNEDDFEGIFGKCRTEDLQVLQLDISGRCMPDYILPATLAKVPNCMPLLRKISMKGNYRLSDNGLDTIISAAPSLSSLNLCQCSLLTSTGISSLANKLQSVLRELYIDECLNVEAMLILPALKKIKHLEVLSMSGIESVSDKFVTELARVHGSNMKELAFAGCLKLTSSSIKTIGENCTQLSSLDIRNLNRLQDSAMRHLGNGCRFLQKLKLQRNIFSDEAVSQFLEESGGCLIELNLNNVRKAGNLTACAIARKCSLHLQVLDLSFCRELTNEALGLIVDSCLSLRILKLFGCTQISDVFLNGHSNSLVKIVGIEGNILENLGNQ